jgi:pyridoxal phosphate enzyme (YggS family)
MEALVAGIREKLENVAARIRGAAQTAGRLEDEVRLVVVTKAQPVEVIRAVLAAGAGILGENYPEETLQKIEALGGQDTPVWHMIGHLQSRKAAIVAALFAMLESLDSLKLAERLERLLAERERVLPVLLEFNVGAEESKYGWPAWDESSWSGLLPEVERILALPHLRLEGLMTMPPWNEDAEKSRPYFTRLRQLAGYLGERFGAQYFSQLSMGTSTDYEVAVQEGATLVRVGTAIVGPRPARNQD